MIDPNTPEIIDLAATVGKEAKDLILAIEDIEIGKFERLKEFGIRMRDEGAGLGVCFRGQCKRIPFKYDSVQDYILSLGRIRGIQGLKTKSPLYLMKKELEELGNIIDKIQTKDDSLPR